VEVSNPLVDKLEIFRGLGVPEVWLWHDARISIHALDAGSYRLKIPTPVSAPV
jgi:hypothetical protein